MKIRSVLALASLFVSASHAATFQNITNWIGAGTNQAGFEIDWNFPGNTNDTFLWGYRWNGDATGEQMLDAVVAGDPRLYAEVSGSTQFGAAVFGFGLDFAGDQPFQLSPSLTFASNHLAASDYNGVTDDRTNVVPGDLWQEGWLSAGYWAYYLSDEARLGVDFSDWDYASTGISERVLKNNAWDGWVFAWNFNDYLPSDPFPGTHLVDNTPRPALRLIHGFNHTDGDNLAGELLTLSNTLYGAASGGSNFSGVLYSVNTDGLEFADIHVFATNDGAYPMGSLTQTGGSLYGTTSGAGFYQEGTIYSVAPDGSDFSVLYNFNITSNLTNLAGANPESGLTVGDNSALFGSAAGGGFFGSGDLFRLDATGGNFLNIHTMAGLDTNGFNLDGYNPSITMTAAGGELFGVVSSGGAHGQGTIFKISQNGSGFTVLHDFAALDLSARTNTEGALPDGRLLFTNGVLYGVANQGGFYSSGCVFSICADGSDFTNLYNFTSDTNGANPVGSLVLDNNLLYGVTQAGGQNGNGTIYQINTNGAGFYTLASFPRLRQGTNAFGAGPQGGLIKVGPSFYGTTGNGGPGQGGTVFALDLPAPPLYVAAVNNQLTVTWPAWAAGYVLETSAYLASTNWQPVAAGLSGPNFIFTTAAQGQNAFFRLRK